MWVRRAACTDRLPTAVLWLPTTAG
ncbi:unnamed protein product [Leptidea sinapis]|uniref:Uncharacterized protein n=1 Tax=Leptidea sinapis TaxID=189913 RepID=A0A5E4R4C7_9NEOP|nr:unnamed protein product [Leptidea sinapis]